MQIVIDIPQKWFDDMVREEFIEVDELCAVIQHGTPLPKGHGRLIDADERIKEIDEEDRWVVDLAETIIEADKGGNIDE